MNWARGVRLLIVVSMLVAALVWVWKTDIKPEKVSLVIAAVVCAVSIIYALFTYEILVQNQAMAKAALDSSDLMEKSLRFSHTPNLLYKTISTKDPTFASAGHAIVPIDNADYKRAVAEFRGDGTQCEFVFAIISNEGQGAATNLKIEATYRVSDSSNPNRDATLVKHASVQIVAPKTATALCIFISKIPTADDGVTLVTASLSAGDFYRDAIKEAPQKIEIDQRIHHIEREANGVVSLA